MPSILASVICTLLIGVHYVQSKAPNIVIFILDDTPFMEEYLESAPKGVNLAGNTVEYNDYPTPHINAFRNEAVIFPKSYCGGPKCAPSRYSILTGRTPSRSESAVSATLRSSDGSEGTDVTVMATKLSGYDSIYNLPRVLQDNGYYTGSVGKWHLLTYTDNGYNLGCSAQADSPDAMLYEECSAIVKESGFDYVDGWYYSNIANNDHFSHNPEWIVSRAQAFIDEAVDVENKPFFLYFASTLAHISADAFDALNEHSITETPKGILSGDEVPDDTSMKTRTEILDLAESTALALNATLEEEEEFAKYLWIDEQFGALIDFLKNKGIYDETMVILQNDHGVGAKGMLYEQGSRIFNFVRYPPLFGTDQTVLSDDLVVSNADLSATIFDLLDITVSSDYTMDGISWLDEVVSAVGDSSEDDGTLCCEYRYIDVLHSRSIVSSRYQYIWRANDEVETRRRVYTYYANVYDEQQLYDLEADPDQTVNLIVSCDSFRRGDLDDSLARTITLFQRMMRQYVDSTCPMADGECSKPSFTFCTETAGSTDASATFSMPAVVGEFGETSPWWIMLMMFSAIAIVVIAFIIVWRVSKKIKAIVSEDLAESQGSSRPPAGMIKDGGQTGTAMHIAAASSVSSVDTNQSRTIL